MTLLTLPAEGPAFPYAGQPMHILAGHGEQPPGLVEVWEGDFTVFVAHVLGLRAPPEPALAFMRDIGAGLSPDIPPDPDRMREIYARHASRLLP